jgi:signal peptidase I
MLGWFEPDYINKSKEEIEFLKKELRYQSDILSAESHARYNEAIDHFTNLKKSKQKAEEGSNALEKLCNTYSDLLKQASRSWRENVEVIFVALVIALGFRAYFLQPFKIPTHSMRPTLLGILPEKHEGKPPNVAQRLWEWAWTGKTYHYVQVTQPGTIQSVQEEPLLGIIPRTIITVGKKSYTIYAPLKEMYEADYDFSTDQSYKAGDELVNFTSENGDHIFVDKMSYNFRPVHRGDVFVFTTFGIKKIEDDLRSRHIEGSEYYIKRCVAIGGDYVRVIPPNLFVNGKVPTGKMFDQIQSNNNGYHGYTIGNESSTYLTSDQETYHIPEDRYWAMGDNSAHSFDSRYWGGVPEGNVIGHALFVYWPVTKRWGVIH